MGAKLTTYYRKKSPTDNEHLRLLKGNKLLLVQATIQCRLPVFPIPAVCLHTCIACWSHPRQYVISTITVWTASNVESVHFTDACAQQYAEKMLDSR